MADLLKRTVLSVLSKKEMNINWMNHKYKTDSEKHWKNEFVTNVKWIWNDFELKWMNAKLMWTKIEWQCMAIVKLRVYQKEN